MAEAQHQHREILLRILRMRMKAGHGGETGFLKAAVAGLPPREQFALILKVIVEFQDLPGTELRTMQFALHGYSPHILNSAEGREFLEQLAAVPNEEIRKAAAKLKQGLAAEEARTGPNREHASPGTGESCLRPRAGIGVSSADARLARPARTSSAAHVAGRVARGRGRRGRDLRSRGDLSDEGERPCGAGLGER